MSDGFKILAIGDVVGEEAHRRLCACLSKIKTRFGADLAIVNAENSMLGRGNGLTPDQADKLFFSGADIITTGNHVYAQRCIYDYLDEKDCIIRPANFAPSCPGKGSTLFETNGKTVLVVNMEGRIGMNDNSLSSPFDKADEILREYSGRYDYAVFDFHAEATSEKFAFASYLDGRASVVFGTHTHVRTADARVLKKGTAFISDIGMCGPIDSALGVESEIIIDLFRTGMPHKFVVSQNPIAISGALFTLSKNENKAISSEGFTLEEKDF